MTLELYFKTIIFLNEKNKKTFLGLINPVLKINWSGDWDI